MNKIIFVTGATSGFGETIAKQFAAQGYDCIITGRREERLQLLAASIEAQYGVKVRQLVFDVQNRDAVFATIQGLPDSWKNISILVNNAGLALGRDPFDQANLDDWETMLNTNVHGLLYVSKAVLPFMKEHGHIFNIGSTAAKEVYKDGNIYCASKAAVDAISKSMRIDLLPRKIKVTAIHPGAAETEFSTVRYKGDQQKADAVYKGYEPLHAEDIAQIIWYCSQLPLHVCINELVVTCLAQANSFYTEKTGV